MNRKLKALVKRAAAALLIIGLVLPAVPMTPIFSFRSIVKPPCTAGGAG